MESASIPARPVRPRGEVLRENISKYGLIFLLLLLPAYYGVKDLTDEGDLSRLANNMKDGLSNGAIWALIAIGYTLVYGIIELINFAHGDLFMIGSFVAFGMIGAIGLTTETAGAALFGGMLVCLIIAMIACGTLNTMIERVAYRPLRNAPKLAPLITAVGFSFILQNVGLLWLGGSHTSVPDLIDSQDIFFTVFGHQHQPRRRARRGRDDPARDRARATSSRARGSAAPCARPPRIPRPRASWASTWTRRSRSRSCSAA